MGQDIALAHPLAREIRHGGGPCPGFAPINRDHGREACLSRPLAEGSPLAQRHGTRFPIVQGPMARVSDTPAFALKVADEGALPFIAAAWMRGPELQQLLEETAARLGGRAWGVGLLGFLDPDHYREQITAVLGRRPPFALIAGGHPEQVKALEQGGIACYVHVPSVGLLRMFLERGIRRFVFEGRESGGHIGPLSSFVLWEGVIEQLLGSTEAPSQRRNARSCSPAVSTTACQPPWWRSWLRPWLPGASRSASRWAVPISSPRKQWLPGLGASLPTGGQVQQ